MRCSSSEWRINRARAALAAFVLAAAFAACRTTTTVTYLPTLERPRLTLEDGGATLRQFLQLDCPAAGSPGGADSVAVRVVVSEFGTVSASELLESSGSATVDDVIGAITAQLTFAGNDPMPAAGESRVLVRYSCVEPVAAQLLLAGR